MDKIYKTFRAELKGKGEDGSLDLFIPVSTMSMDRDGEVVEPAAFKRTLKKFMEHPVLVSSHDYRNLTKQIGEWTKLKITDNGIEGKPKYYKGEGNEEADWAYNLASKGRAAFSIGFIPKEWEDGDGEKSAKRTYKDVELLEISQVIIPSNREAIMSMRSKSVDPVISQLIEDIINAPIVDLTGESDIVTKPEETGEVYRMPVPGEEGKHEGHRIRQIEVSADKGINALYCGTDKKIITYMFDKEKWDSMEAARAWMMEHMGKRSVSQAEIKDEIDYLCTLVEQEGLSEEGKQSMSELLKVLNTPPKIKNMGKMQEMHDMMQSCEGMAKKAKKMSEDMMSEYEDMDDEKRVPASDIAVKENDTKPEDVKPEQKKPDTPIQPTLEEIQLEIGNIKF